MYKNDIIIWTNKNSYDHKIIVSAMKFISDNMDGLTPLYDSELTVLKKYASEHKLPVEMIVSLRNLVKIQKEIKASYFYHKYTERVIKRFVKLCSEFTDDQDVNAILIYNFFSLTNLPVNLVLKTVTGTKEYQSLNPELKKEINSMWDDSVKHNRLTGKAATRYEEEICVWLRENVDIGFQTENEIKTDTPTATSTPDILLDKPLKININGIIHSIKWIDAKNYILADVPFIVKKLQKQVNKYHESFGLGAFVFGLGFDRSIKLDNVVVLDGSFIKN